MSEDIRLYRELLSFCEEIRKNQKFKFGDELCFTDFHEHCYDEMYLNNRKNDLPLKPAYLKDKIPKLKETYSKLAKFYATKRNEMIKGFDIQHGHWFESAFREFLKSKGITTEKKGFPFPDIEITKNSKAAAYFELKYIRAPFVYANKFVDSSRWDYECSLTLDVGEKLKNQRKKIEDDLLSKKIPVFYVWWCDFPHIKGIFFMSAEEIFAYWDHEGTAHVRKERGGDSETHQEKGKIYPPLLKMEGLAEFLKTLLDLIK